MGKKIETYLGALLVGDGAFQLPYFFLDMYGRGKAVNDLLHAPIFRWLANPFVILVCLIGGIVFLFRGEKPAAAQVGLYDAKGKKVPSKRPTFHMGWASLTSALAGLILFGVVYLVAAHRVKGTTDKLASTVQQTAPTPVPVAPPKQQDKPEQPRVKPPTNPKPQKLPYGRVEVPVCPPGMQVFRVSESTISDNGGCAYTSPAEACVIIENHSFIQRNTGGGICIGTGLNHPTTSPNGGMDGPRVFGLMPDGHCAIVLHDFRITGFDVGINTVGPDGGCIELDKSVIKGNGTGVVGGQLPPPAPATTPTTPQ